MAITLRAFTLLAKFAFVILLARFLPPADVGIYGLLVVSISYTTYVAGLEFYAYAGRSMLSQPRDLWRRMLHSQMALLGLTYLLVGPLAILTIFGGALLPWWLAPAFVAILLVEHAATEAHRVLNLMGRYFQATVIGFLRHGFWCLAVLFVFWISDSSRTLTTVALVWWLGASLAAVVGVACLADLPRDRSAARVDWRWLRTGIRTSALFFVSALALRGLFTFDRYAIEALGGPAVLAAYVVMMSLANALVATIDTLLLVHLQPRIVQAGQTGEVAQFSEGMRQLTIGTVMILIVGTLIVLMGSGPLLEWLGNPLYLEHAYLLHWSLGVIALYGISLIPHVGLYAKGFDQAITISHLLALIVFLAFSAKAMLVNTTSWLLIGVVCAFGTLAACKTGFYFYDRHSNKHHG